jgi:asparagine synthase (glutamine-hydrolysing)
MCGFFFVVQRETPVAETALQSAGRSLLHRGPDFQDHKQWGLEIDDGNGSQSFHLGAFHARLSIIDLDPRSNQPYVRGDHGLLYNGEIYNYRALRAGLSPREWITEGDTEVLFELVRDRNIKAVNAISGFWSYVFWDNATATVSASRDRLGKKPLFYF